MLRAFLLFGVCVQWFAGVATAADGRFAHFEAEIRPILVNRCYECHDAESGPDSANLRLDYRAGWTTGGDSGPAIDPDQLDASLLLRAISYDDPDLQMPPRSKLPQRELDLLRAWVVAGAPAPDEEPTATTKGESFDLAARRAAHWAWQPVVRAAPPRVDQTAWCRDDVDRFVLARLEAAGLAPAAAADRATWLRRVTYDLTGLPPTVNEVEALLADEASDALERVVDRLLDGPAFSEHWAQHWLDLMRFAESKGHEQDFDIPYAWRYRDYVIRAFRAGVPYDQFVVEHMAGDLLPNPRIDSETRTNQSIQATGWWHLGEATHSPVDIRGEEANRIDNQIDVFGKALLGMTVACARCHDHKFDAISTADYYALCGFIQSSSYQEANIADPELRQRIAHELANLQQEAGRRIFRLYAEQAKHRLPQLLLQPTAAQASELVAKWRDVAAVDDGREAANDTPSVTVVDFAGQMHAHDDWLTSGYAFGDGPAAVGEVLVNATEVGPPLRVVEYAAATNQQAGCALTGLYRTRTFEVVGKKLWYHYRGTAEVLLDVDSHRTVSGPLHAVCKQELASPDEWQWFAHDVSDYVGHRVHVDFKSEKPFALAQVCLADQQPQGLVACGAKPLKVSAGDASGDFKSTLRQAIRALTRALDAVDAQRATTRDAQLVNWLLANDHVLPPGERSAAAELVAAWGAYRARRSGIEAQLPEPQYAIALMDGSGEDEHVHLRGSHKRVAPEATPRRMLTALGRELPSAQGSGRLELARQVASSQNPLTARVMVNRVWAHLMGRGIVPTVDNFGVLGQSPTHPQLLDTLAGDFMESGWDTKQLIRRLVLSSTYRQGSRPSEAIAADALDAADPANDLIHKTRVRRLPAEAIRDALLAVSGTLDATSFGPSVPVHITDFMRHNRSPAGSGPLDGEGRRSIYVEVRRNAFNHFLAAFDKPVPFSTVGFRHQSNSAAQPLMLLNDPLVHHVVGRWAADLTTAFASDHDAIRHAYLAAFARLPSADEQQQITSFLDQQAQMSVARSEAWHDVCLALVNNKEFVFLQ